MTIGLIGRSAGRLLVPFIFIFGFYIVVHGHLTPGGGFQGGAVIATGVALILVCYYYRECMERFIPVKSFKLIESAGLMLFICTALAGLVAASGFLFNWLNASGGLFGHAVAYGINPGDLYTAGIIPVLNFAIGIEVFGALSAVLMFMFAGLKEPTQEEDDAESSVLNIDTDKKGGRK
ncbi:MAG TPA: Na(+)/H(+) antiporter subunit B [Methanocorpusculum sp.]|uniref:Na(+)/H(+) antiporter subunit B n=1 Tax=Methanocorpusculum sp. TaxID=2058474 RepID=UPI002B20FDA9|nr:Na(+)/H(+) antiporter subunit B [Methanocorpusculum sp.]MEA5085817.1 Na(+)/H(+) antiporter subunit B [Methanocorpusculum sp.]HJJ38177.1 Na(+)/H(+) antiporter subunit B [Methanocorpusculum sp.]